jgi:hypothetical protein
LAHDGLDLAEGTLAGVLAACSDLLAPLTDKISERNAGAAHLHVDETRWQVFAAVEGKDSHRWWLWVFAGPDTTVFRIAPSRSLKVLTTQLGVEHDPDTGALPDALPAGRRLLLSSDFYTVYQSVGRMDGVNNLWCWSHIRRYFVRAGDAHPDLQAWTTAWLERIGALYRAHSALAAAAPLGRRPAVPLPRHQGRPHRLSARPTAGPPSSPTTSRTPAGPAPPPSRSAPRPGPPTRQRAGYRGWRRSARREPMR